MAVVFNKELIKIGDLFPGVPFTAPKQSSGRYFNLLVILAVLRKRLKHPSAVAVSALQLTPIQHKRKMTKTHKLRRWL